MSAVSCDRGSIIVYSGCWTFRVYASAKHATSSFKMSQDWREGVPVIAYSIMSSSKTQGKRKMQKRRIFLSGGLLPYVRRAM
jgi:hypothetical protein